MKLSWATIQEKYDFAASHISWKGLLG